MRNVFGMKSINYGEIFIEKLFFFFLNRIIIEKL